MASTPPDGLRRLRDRGAPADLVDTIAASGLPGDAAWRAVERAGVLNRLRILFNPRAPLNARELARLAAIATLARAVAADEGGPEGARRFWDGAMLWLDGRSPAWWLARGHIGVVEDLRVRINYGIPP